MPEKVLSAWEKLKIFKFKSGSLANYLIQPSLSQTFVPFLRYFMFEIYQCFSFKNLVALRSHSITADRLLPFARFPVFNLKRLKGFSLGFS